MSSDNGIYLLKTKAPDGEGHEYRVAHAQAIDNIYWDHRKGHFREDGKFTPSEAFRYFGQAPMFWECVQALTYANELSHEYDVLEYGICVLEHGDQVFQAFTDEELEEFDTEAARLMRERRAAREAERQAKLRAATIPFGEGMVFEPGAIYGYLVKADGTRVHGSLSGIKQLTTRLERIGPAAYAVHLEYINGHGEALKFLPSDWSEKEEGCPFCCGDSDLYSPPFRDSYPGEPGTWHHSLLQYDDEAIDCQDSDALEKAFQSGQIDDKGRPASDWYKE